ncbi:uncharacterized protein LY89DRAFT_680476 [Mollisia scopiformis]|uniref:2EXR domain-containing protein n=1 Tax=Mollisia scopiformis TaxID=149040 RepID=A0A194XQK9_MOLSC|nr:uncharacterized protein LY89DRAFT_680476 [Mollisia scopiformis]KUJ22344.1 hypothetical protein LY89DRAFT_680476 [Mollisia scopiformis]
MASVRRSARIAARLSVVPATPRTKTRSGGMRAARKFTLFPDLPLEMQQKILSFACLAQQAEKRFLRVARDTEEEFQQRNNNNDYTLRIYYEGIGGPRLVPSMLHVCRYSRALLLDHYQLVSCTDMLSGSEVERNIYVNLDEDIFFFGDLHPAHFKALRILVFHPDEREPLNFGLDTGKRIKNLAVDWEIYREMMKTDPSWLLSVNPDTIFIGDSGYQTWYWPRDSGNRHPGVHECIGG